MQVFSSLGALTSYLKLEGKGGDERFVLAEIIKAFPAASQSEHVIIPASAEFKYLYQLLISGILRGDELFIKAGFLLMNDSSLTPTGRQRQAVSVLLSTLTLLADKLNASLQEQNVNGKVIDSFNTSYALIFVYLGFHVAQCRIAAFEKRVADASPEELESLQAQLKTMQNALNLSMKRHYDWDNTNGWKAFYTMMLKMQVDSSIPDQGTFGLTEETMEKINKSLQEALHADAIEIEKRTVLAFTDKYEDGLAVIATFHLMVPNLNNTTLVTDDEKIRTCVAFEDSYKRGVDTLIFFKRYTDSISLANTATTISHHYISLADSLADTLLSSHSTTSLTTSALQFSQSLLTTPSSSNISSSESSASLISSSLSSLTLQAQDPIVLDDQNDTKEESNYEKDAGSGDLENTYGIDQDGIVADDDQSKLTIWLGAVRVFTILSNPGTITLVSSKLLGVEALPMTLFDEEVLLRFMHNPVHPGDSGLRIPLQAKGILNFRD
jgi:hypothetical protein